MRAKYNLGHLTCRYWCQFNGVLQNSHAWCDCNRLPDCSNHNDWRWCVDHCHLPDRDDSNHQGGHILAHYILYLNYPQLFCPANWSDIKYKVCGILKICSINNTMIQTCCGNPNRVSECWSYTRTIKIWDRRVGSVSNNLILYEYLFDYLL